MAKGIAFALRISFSIAFPHNVRQDPQPPGTYNTIAISQMVEVREPPLNLKKKKKKKKKPGLIVVIAHG